jgi:hypothetical protein
LVEKRAQTIELEYEKPELVEYGDLAVLTAGALHDPIHSGPHGGPHFDPHLTHSG